MCRSIPKLMTDRLQVRPWTYVIYSSAVFSLIHVAYGDSVAAAQHVPGRHRLGFRLSANAQHLAGDPVACRDRHAGLLARAGLIQDWPSLAIVSAAEAALDLMQQRQHPA